jgi:hypothetical protein
LKFSLILASKPTVQRFAPSPRLTMIEQASVDSYGRRTLFAAKFEDYPLHRTEGLWAKLKFSSRNLRYFNFPADE